MAWCPNCRRSFSNQKTLRKHRNLCDLERKEFDMKQSIKDMERRDIECKNLCDEVLEAEVMRLQAENKELEAQVAELKDNEIFTDSFITTCRAEIVAELTYDPQRREYYMSELVYAEKFKKWAQAKAKESEA